MEVIGNRYSNEEDSNSNQSENESLYLQNEDYYSDSSSNTKNIDYFAEEEGSRLIDLKLLMMFINKIFQHTLQCRNKLGFRLFSEDKAKYHLKVICQFCNFPIKFTY